MHKRIPISCVDYWGTVFYVVMMLANYDTPLIREETRPLMCMAEQQWGSEEVRPLALPSTLHDLPPVHSSTTTDHPTAAGGHARASGLGKVEREVLECLCGPAGGVVERLRDCSISCSKEDLVPALFLETREHCL